jgi:hypothetical protein
MHYDSARDLKDKLFNDFICTDKPTEKKYSYVEERASYPASSKEDLYNVINGVSIIRLEDDFKVKIFTEGNISSQMVAGYFGIKTQDLVVDDIGPITILGHPIPPGTRIFHCKGAIGTFACYVKDKNGQLHLLSNNHVLSNFTKGKIGDSILIGGPKNTGSNIIGNVSALYPVQFDGKINRVDCGLAEILADEISNEGFENKTISPQVDSEVWKKGASTGLTRGKILSLEASIKVDYGSSFWRKRFGFFNGQIEIKSIDRDFVFSNLGDSGSLLVDNDSNRPAGLVFAGSTDGTTFANPINEVLNTLSIEFL